MAAWRAALDSIPTAASSPVLLSSYDKGQLVAMIAVQKVYKEADINASIVGLDEEGLCGFFKTLVSTPASKASPAPGPSPAAPSTAWAATNPTPTPKSASPLSASAAPDRTPITGGESHAVSLEAFEKWLKSTPCQKFTSTEDVYIFLEKAPISSKALKFIKRHLHHVPKSGAHLRTSDCCGERYFVRDDIFSRLCDLGKRDVKAVMISGRKRFGKTLALPHELVRARKQVLGVRDRAVFYYPGYGPIPELHFRTVISLLAHMKIPALFDEFTNVHEIEMGKAYKLLLETTQNIEPLTAVLFGSDEVSIWNKGLWSFQRLASGTSVERLAVPPLCIMYSMLLLKEPHLQGCELGLRFLRKMALYGYDLSSHMDAELPESLETLKETGMQAFSSFHGGYLTALDRLVKNSNCSSGVDTFLRGNLEEAEYIVKRPNHELIYDFLNPQTVAYQASLTNENLEKIEEKVLEQLVRLKKHLFEQLLWYLGVCASATEILDATWHDSGKFLFFYDKEMFLVSTDRSKGAQHWQKSFVRRLDALFQCSLEDELFEKLVGATKLRFVAVSAIGDGDIGGMKPSFYSLSGVSSLERKEVTCESLYLHQLLDRLEKADCL